jgi:DNA polymerase-3 subunit epsilon
MSRQIVLDTETTGLNVAEGHRVIEIGAVEILNRRLSGERFHEYFNPGRGIEAGALAVHGISEEFLEDKPPFEEVAEEFLRFIDGAELVIHNAPFDLGFLDGELARLEQPKRVQELCPVLDTLAMARELHPGQRNSLDALCSRYGVDNSGRQLHGALLDAEILAEVYLAMTGGQATLDLGAAPPARPRAQGGAGGVKRPRGALRVLRADADEVAAHEQRLAALDAASGGRCVWRTLEG